MERDDWIKAGKIASDAREFSKEIVIKNAKILDIAEKIEAKIKELGGVPAFPVNISMNEVAAHYTPVHNDEIILTDQVVKIDIGACYNGAIGDTAYTVDLSGKYTELVKASQEALKAAAELLKPGITLGEIGKAIQDAINNYGYAPVKNLSGHGLSINDIHDEPQVPNYNTKDPRQLKKGQVIAIEPFATTGVGMIKESGAAIIYSQVSAKPIRDMFARKIMADASQYEGRPFALRWIENNPRVKLALRQLVLNGNIREYPPLAEVNKGIVSQAEDSFLIEDEIIVLTR